MGGEDDVMPDARTGIAGLEEELARQRRYLRGRSPPYGRALELLPGVLSGRPGRYLAAAWEHRRFHAWYDRPLLLLAALRADARAEGPSHPLYPSFAAPEPRAELVTAEALGAALDATRERVHDALARRVVQTNETFRAVAWLWPAFLAGASNGRRPLALADVGASAGLNLVADDLPAPWTFEDGSPVDVARGIHAVARLGLDQAPLGAGNAGDADWLRACIWPGEREREERLEAALAAFRAARPRTDAPVLVPIAARNVPARLDLLSAAEAGALVLAYQTVVRDFLAPEERDEYEAGMRTWVATHPPGHALWVELEGALDGAEPEQAAALVAHVRTADGMLRSFNLARCGHHPTRLTRNAAAVEGLAAAFREAAAREAGAPAVP
jgi:hypothetical protein